LKVEIKNTIRGGKVFASGTKMFPLGSAQGRRAPNLNLDPLLSPNLSELEREYLKAIRYDKVLALDTIIFPLGGLGRSVPNVNLGTPLSRNLLVLES